MLVLTRKENETIRIGNDIVVTVVRTGVRARIGIDAPANMAIVRGELKGFTNGAVPLQQKPVAG